jgi:DNA processing protein
VDGRPDLTRRELQARLQLFLAPGVGPRRIRDLVERGGSASTVLDGVVAGSGPLGEVDWEAQRRAALRLEEQCAVSGVAILCPGFAGFPPALEALDPPPPVLFSAGALLADRPRRVAVVGARRASAYGRRVARRLGRELAEEGCTVLSGMALGVDAEAHAGALEAGGVTVAVLGSGPDRAYPAVHRALHRRILDSGGVLSEHPPGTEARPHHFPRRNRILAGLAEAVVVVEAGERSGALITAGASAAATVFAVPGSVESPLSRGTFALLRDGAIPLSSAADLLEGMGWRSLRPHGERAEGPADLGRVEAAVWRLLGPEPTLLDELVRGTGVPPARVLAALGVLEVGGWVLPSPGGRYVQTPGPPSTPHPAGRTSGSVGAPPWVQPSLPGLQP